MVSLYLTQLLRNTFAVQSCSEECLLSCQEKQQPQKEADLGQIPMDHVSFSLAMALHSQEALVKDLFVKISW